MGGARPFLNNKVVNLQISGICKFLSSGLMGTDRVPRGAETGRDDALCGRPAALCGRPAPASGLMIQGSGWFRFFMI